MKAPLHEALRHFDEGVDHQQHGRLEAAKASYQHAVVNADKALLYERMDLFDEAIAAYHAALNCDPSYLKLLYILRYCTTCKEIMTKPFYISIWYWILVQRMYSHTIIWVLFMKDGKMAGSYLLQW